MKKIGLIFLSVIILCFVSCGTDNASQESLENGGFSDLSDEEANVNQVLGEEISIVVLGDSIARGYGLAPVESQRFSDILKVKLENDYTEVNVSNYGEDGLTGAELVEKIPKLPKETLESADYMIISIGANNILRPLGETKLYTDIFTNRLPEIWNKFAQKDSTSDENSENKWEQIVQTVNESFDGINRILDGEEIAELISNATTMLESEIPIIVSEIREVNPNCRIYIQTVYNPYENIDIYIPGIESYIDMEYYGEKAVSALNKVIESLSEEYGYAVAPIWQEFEDSHKDLVNSSYSLLKMNVDIDPHPNAKGHALIGEVYYKLITENTEK